VKRRVWEKFVKARESFRNITEKLERSLPELKTIQQKIIDKRSNGKNSFYTVETPVVYNTALDDITINDDIKLIMVADNPGRREQVFENRRYLSGPSGKIAFKFFKDNPSLGIDFAKNVIVLNKTFVHTPRTNELREIYRIIKEMSGDSAAIALDESQKNMACLLLEFHETFGVPVFITGYSEMRNGGIFEVYTKMLKQLYKDKNQLYNKIYIFRHFSMNQFTIDLKRQSLPGESVSTGLKRIGCAYRKQILEDWRIVDRK
jgi:hypothetical protein